MTLGTNFQVIWHYIPKEYGPDTVDVPRKELHHMLRNTFRRYEACWSLALLRLCYEIR
jgi:hypothetical protein